MPNTAVAVNAGTIGLALHSSANSVAEQITTLLNKLGSCSIVAEDQLDAVVGVAGSGIAYVSYPLMNGGMIYHMIYGIEVDVFPIFRCTR